MTVGSPVLQELYHNFLTIIRIVLENQIFTIRQSTILFLIIRTSDSLFNSLLHLYMNMYMKTT